MRSLLLSFCGLVALAGCYRLEQSAPMVEAGKVEQVLYNQSTEGTAVSSHVDVNGNPGMSVTSYGSPAKYGVIFRCRHGRFVIQGSDERYKDLWGRFDVGQAVDIQYREVYQVDKEGRKKLYQYDFLDAVPAVTDY